MPPIHSTSDTPARHPEAPHIYLYMSRALRSADPAGRLHITLSPAYFRSGHGNRRGHGNLALLDISLVSPTI